MLEIELLSPSTDKLAEFQLYIAATATSTCTMRENLIQQDDVEKNIGLLTKILNAGHTSVLEHITYTFKINNISRAVLQELSRHRHTSPTVQSTRWALKKKITDNFDENSIYIPDELDKSDRDKYIHMMDMITSLRNEITEKYGNDVGKYLVVENLYINEVLTINARSLINMFELRTSKRALKEFRNMMCKIYEILPESHKFMYRTHINMED